MQTLPPPPAMGDFTMINRPNRVRVDLTGTSAISQNSEFTASIWVGAQSLVYRPDREFRSDYAIDLTIAVNFTAGRPLRATARIVGFQNVALRLVGSSGLQADIDHALNATKKCRLLCLENGDTSNGPCLTCPDGQYQIQICC